MKQQQYQRIEAGKDIKVSTLLRILEGLKLSFDITENEKRVSASLPKTESEEGSFGDDELQHLKDE